MKTPSKTTLQKYGLTEDLWIELLERQGGVCYICQKLPKKNFVTDHEHVPKYKDKLPEEKRKFIRGLTCWYCNFYFLRRGITTWKAKNIIMYLEEYEERRANL